MKGNVLQLRHVGFKHSFLSLQERKDKQNSSNYACPFPQPYELSAPNLCRHAFDTAGQIHTAIKYREGARKADNFEEASAVILDIDLDPSRKSLWSRELSLNAGGKWF